MPAAVWPELVATCEPLTYRLDPFGPTLGAMRTQPPVATLECPSAAGHPSHRCRDEVTALCTLRRVETETRRIATADSYPLRQAVLRPHQSLGEMHWEHDDDAETATFAVVDTGDGSILTVATVQPEAAPPGLAESIGVREDACSWRLRGMATRPELQGQGLGTRVLAAAVEHVRAGGGTLLWCNARVPAVPFYEKAGLATWGEQWELPQIGPHVVMWMKIGDLRHD